MRQLEPIYTSYFPFAALRFIGIDARRWSIESAITSAVSVFEKHMTRPDVVFAHFLIPSGIAAARISERFGVPAFCSVGESRCSTWFDYYGRSDIRALLASFAGIFPVSSAIADYITTECDVSPDRLVVVPNGVDRALFRPHNRWAARRSLGVGARAKVALFVGSAARRKGAELLADAAERLLDWQVWLVGPGHRRYSQKNIRTFGVIEQTKLPKFYAAADVFVLPSEAEGMPNSLLEAIACGTPAVVSKTPAMTEVLGDDYPYLCSLTAADVASAIRRAALGGVGYPPSIPWDIRQRAATIIRSMSESVFGRRDAVALPSNLESGGARSRWHSLLAGLRRHILSRPALVSKQDTSRNRS